MKDNLNNVKTVFNAVFTRCAFFTGTGLSQWYSIRYTDTYPYIGYIVARDKKTKQPKPLIVKVAGQEKDLCYLAQCN